MIKDLKLPLENPLYIFDTENPMSVQNNQSYFLIPRLNRENPHVHHRIFTARTKTPRKLRNDFPAESRQTTRAMTSTPTMPAAHRFARRLRDRAPYVAAWNVTRTFHLCIRGIIRKPVRWEMEKTEVGGRELNW